MMEKHLTQLKSWDNESRIAIYVSLAQYQQLRTYEPMFYWAYLSTIINDYGHIQIGKHSQEPIQGICYISADNFFLVEGYFCIFGGVFTKKGIRFANFGTFIFFRIFVNLISAGALNNFKNW